MHVQKLTRRQSMAIYSVPNQVGFLFSLSASVPSSSHMGIWVKLLLLLEKN